MPDEEGGSEKKANAAPKAGGSIFDSIGSSLEDLVKTVKSIPGAVKDVAYYTYYTAKATLGLTAGVAIAGTIHALVFPLGMTAGAVLPNWIHKEKKTFRETYKQIANELAVGGILSGFLHHLFAVGNKLGNIVKSTYGAAASLLTKGGYALAQMPVFLGAHEYLNRALISGYKPKPLKDVWKQIKVMWPIIPPIVANFTVVPPAYQMPTAAGVSVGYGLLRSEPKKKEKEAAPSPYGLPPGYAMPRAA